MQFFCKTTKITLYFICLIFLSQMVFAQDVDIQKSDIYSKLRDRRCEMPLDKCDCPDAKEMKAYVGALIETGVSKEDIFYKVAKKFSLRSIIDKQIKSDIEKRLIKEAGEKRSQIVLEPTTLDFGKVSKKQGKVSRIVKLQNKGKAALVISNLRVSCGCANVSLKAGKNKSHYFGTSGAPFGWQETIAPGKVGELEVVLDLNHPLMTLGKQIREVFISSNDPIYSESAIRAEIEIEE